MKMIKTKISFIVDPQGVAEKCTEVSHIYCDEEKKPVKAFIFGTKTKYNNSFHVRPRAVP